MNILLANYSWYPSGGDWTYIDSICKLYESKGHHIIPFAVQDSRNFQTPYDKYFLESIDYKKFYNKLTLKSGLKVLTKSIYSTEAKKKLQLLLSENKVDIAQLNSITNYHTPSIIPVLKKANIPMIWRILDYRLICPNTTFLVNDNICEACFKHKYYNCILKRCKKKSFLASSLLAIESYVYYFLPYYKNIDLFLFQSEFTRDMFVKFGYDVKKTHIIENPYDCSNIQPNYEGKRYILYFGRLSKEKGVFTLLKAMKSLPHIELKVVGNGPEYEKYVNFVAEESISNVSFLGAKWDKELEPIIKDCEFVIVPSEWYDPSPYVVLQAFSYGKPVIASAMGGLKDMVVKNENGLLFQAHDIKGLSDEIQYLFQNKDLIKQMGMKGRKLLEKKYNPERYYIDTMNVFKELAKGTQL